jgi:hypothetical protein
MTIVIISELLLIPSLKFEEEKDGFERRDHDRPEGGY